MSAGKGKAQPSVLPKPLGPQVVEWPTKGNPRIRCKPWGQVVLDPEILDGSLSMRAEHRGTLLAALGAAIGQAQLPVYDIRWRFQACCMIRHRPTTALDAVLESTELVVLDASQHMDPSLLECPHCGAKAPSEHQWHDNASSFKGSAETPTIYVASMRRSCSK
jgi:hypothetical protein